MAPAGVSALASAMHRSHLTEREAAEAHLGRPAAASSVSWGGGQPGACLAA